MAAAGMMRVGIVIRIGFVMVMTVVVVPVIMTMSVVTVRMGMRVTVCMMVVRVAIAMDVSLVSSMMRMPPRGRNEQRRGDQQQQTNGDKYA